MGHLSRKTKQSQQQHCILLKLMGAMMLEPVLLRGALWRCPLTMQLAVKTQVDGSTETGVHDSLQVPPGRAIEPSVLLYGQGGTLIGMAITSTLHRGMLK